MSGKKGMKHYSEELKNIIINEYKSGLLIKSLSKKYNVSRYSIQSWCGLRSEKNIFKKTRGRKPKIKTAEAGIK